MKPNGRRAWRKWCKRARLHMNKHHRALYRGAIMRKKQPERTSLPTKPSTARSLVGMTMGARKRAARADCFGIRTKVHDFRTLLRIGERLRPCPGCKCCGYSFPATGAQCGSPQKRNARHNRAFLRRCER